MSARGTKRPAAGALLVPIDGSRNALRALDHALATARATGAAIHLLNVELPMDNYGMVGAYLSRSRHRQETAARAKALLEPAVKRAEEAGIATEAHVAWGVPSQTIARTARRLKCAGIVMGTRGMGKAGVLLLGSTANAVVHLARVPVTLVK